MSAGIAPAARTSLDALLKERTAEHHARADRHPLQQAAVRGRLDRPTYAAMSAQMRGLHEALETALDAAAERESRLASLFKPHHRRASLYGADLAVLDPAARQRGEVSQTREVRAWIAALADSNPIALTGVLYVVEGSTNGGQFIARALGPALGVVAGPGLIALNPHGERTRELWAQFRAALDALPVTGNEIDAIVAAAAETFDRIGEMLDGVMGAGSPARA